MSAEKWRAEHNDFRGNWDVMAGPEYEPECIAADVVGEERAKRIAAAQELYEVASDLIAWEAGAQDAKDWRALLDRARAALAKARGES